MNPTLLFWRNTLYCRCIDALLEGQEREFAKGATSTSLFEMASPDDVLVEQERFVGIQMRCSEHTSARLPRRPAENLFHSRTRPPTRSVRTILAPVEQLVLGVILTLANPSAAFYFFSGGCTAGIDCHFCHEFHPRKRAKKNRTVLRRIYNSRGGSRGAPFGTRLFRSAAEMRLVCFTWWFVQSSFTFSLEHARRRRRDAAACG